MGRNRRNIALLLIGVVLAIAFLALVPALAHPPLSEADLRGISPERRIALQQAQAQLRDGMRASLLQAIAGVVIVLGAVATWRQVRVNQDGHLTAHFSRAVEHVGDDNLDVRIGGIYALERIARTSPEDLVTVQAALNVLGRHAAGRSEGRLYLPRTDLRSLQINDGADLSGANFNHANLARASLRGVSRRHRPGLRRSHGRAARPASGSDRSAVSTAVISGRGAAGRRTAAMMRRVTGGVRGLVVTR